MRIVALIYNGIALVMGVYYGLVSKFGGASEAILCVIMFGPAIWCLLKPMTWLKIVVALICALQLLPFLNGSLVPTSLIGIAMLLGPIITLIAVFSRRGTAQPLPKDDDVAS